MLTALTWSEPVYSARANCRLAASQRSSAAGVAVDESRVTALVAALDDVDIEAAIAQASGPVPAGAATTGAPKETESPEAAEVEEEEPEDEADEGSAEEGLGPLFG